MPGFRSTRDRGGLAALDDLALGPSLERDVVRYRRIVLRLDRRLPGLRLGALELVRELTVRVCGNLKSVLRVRLRRARRAASAAGALLPDRARHIRSHRVCVLALDQIGRHLTALRKGDLLPDHALDRAATEAVRDRLLERQVQVRPLHALGPGVLEDVAGATALREELLPPRGVGLLAASAPRGQEQGPDCERGGDPGGSDPYVRHQRSGIIRIRAVVCHLGPPRRPRRRVANHAHVPGYPSDRPHRERPGQARAVGSRLRAARLAQWQSTVLVRPGFSVRIRGRALLSTSPACRQGSRQRRRSGPRRRVPARLGECPVTAS